MKLSAASSGFSSPFSKRAPFQGFSVCKSLASSVKVCLEPLRKGHGSAKCFVLEKTGGGLLATGFTASPPLHVSVSLLGTRFTRKKPRELAPGDVRIPSALLSSLGGDKNNRGPYPGRSETARWGLVSSLPLQEEKCHLTPPTPGVPPPERCPETEAASGSRVSRLSVKAREGGCEGLEARWSPSRLLSSTIDTV